MKKLTALSKMTKIRLNEVFQNSARNRVKRVVGLNRHAFLVQGPGSHIYIKLSPCNNVQIISEQRATYRHLFSCHIIMTNKVIPQLIIKKECLLDTIFYATC